MRELQIRNFRDIGGYRNRYGETMKKNCIFRGGPLNMITREDALYMEQELGIRYILDYRDEQEASLAPDITFPNAEYERVGALQIEQPNQPGFDFGSLAKGEMSPEKLKFLQEYITEGYRRMPFNNPAYHRLFDLLLKNDGHIYFHCSAGKDRTGISAFLIMTALGMSEEDAITEYMLSNTYLAKCNQNHSIPKEMQKAYEPLLYVQKENILHAIRAIKETYRDYEEFLEREYGIDRQKRNILRDSYCE